MTREISDIGWEMDGTCLITYLDTRDIRCEGAVAVRNTIRITRSEQYAEGIDAIFEAARALVKDALGDWTESDPVELPEVDGPRQGRAFEAQPETEQLDELDDEAPGTAVEDRNWQAIEKAREATEQLRKERVLSTLGERCDPANGVHVEPHVGCVFRGH